MREVDSKSGMSGVFTWGRGIAAIALLAVPVGACDDAPEDGADAQWLEYELAARIDPDVPGRYMVEGDIFIGGEDRLRRFYDGGLQERAWVDSGYGLGIGDTRLEVVNTATQLELTYCVSTDPTSGFTGALHTQIVDEMHEASVKWERAAGVNFIYRPQFDSTCTNGNSGVFFAVRKTANVANGCASAFFPGEHPNSRILWFEHPINNSCTNLDRTFTHELGHILGLRHEEDRPGSCLASSVGPNDEVLSEYDQNSIMHNGSVCGVGGAWSVVGRRDAAAVRFLYRNPKDNWYQGPSHQASDFNGDGKKDIYWYRTEPLLLPALPPTDRIMYGAAVPTFVNSANSPLGNLLRPVAGDYDADGRTDLFFYETGSGTPGGGVDTLMIKQAANTDTFTTNTLTSLSSFQQPLSGHFFTQFQVSPTPDIAFYGPGPGTDLQLAGAPGTAAGMQWVNVPGGPSWVIGDATNYYEPIVGDFDANSSTDIFFYNPDDPLAHKYASNAAGTGFIGGTVVNMNFPQLTGDGTATFHYSNVTGKFDNDRPHDILFYAPGQTNVTFLFGGASGPGTTVAQALDPSPGDIYHPFAGDFDGDGDSDVYWFNTARSASDKVWWMTGVGATFVAATVTAGDTGHHDRLPPVGDYSGDGIHDILWWQPADGSLSLWTGAANQLFTVNNLADTVPAYPLGYALY